MISPQQHWLHWCATGAAFYARWMRAENAAGDSIFYHQAFERKVLLSLIGMVQLLKLLLSRLNKVTPSLSLPADSLIYSRFKPQAIPGRLGILCGIAENHYHDQLPALSVSIRAHTERKCCPYIQHAPIPVFLIPIIFHYASLNFFVLVIDTINQHCWKCDSWISTKRGGDFQVVIHDLAREGNWNFSVSLPCPESYLVSQMGDVEIDATNLDNLVCTCILVECPVQADCMSNLC